jgi:F0F1-type ATP synthase assembly protein I
MTRTEGTQDSEQLQAGVAFIAAGVLAQVGCLTFFLIGIAIGAGLWLDTQFGTKPFITVVLVLASVPLTFYLVLRLVLRGTSNLQRKSQLNSTQEKIEEEQGGENP